MNLQRRDWRRKTGIDRRLMLNESPVLEPSVLLLLVEDEELIAESMKVALEDGGFMIAVESTGNGAMEALDGLSDRLSGLITDVRLPDGPDGWDIARRARELRAEIPVVYMTGDSAVDWTAKGVPKSAVLQKPFAPAQLVTAISTLLMERDGHSR